MPQTLNELSRATGFPVPVLAELAQRGVLPQRNGAFDGMHMLRNLYVEKVKGNE